MVYMSHENLTYNSKKKDKRKRTTQVNKVIHVEEQKQKLAADLKE